MLRFIIILLPASLVTTASGAEAINVMSFNIRYDNPRDGLNNWRFRKAQVVGIFKDHNIDIAGLQEVLHGQLSNLKKQLPGYACTGVGRDDGKKSGEYSPVFYQADRFELTRHKTIWLSPTPEKIGSKGWDAALPRIATFAWLKSRTSEQSLLVVNTHFDHRGKIARRNSAALIAQWVEQLNERQLPVVVMGDLNCLPDAAPYGELAAAGFRDGLKITRSKHTGPTGTWNGFGDQVEKDRRIDFVFVNKRVEVLEHQIDSRMLNGRFPSDHCPVIAKIAW
ncbi:MAG: endonuclease/exonuclease/phosphatase family protein [Pirellulales bacterium]